MNQISPLEDRVLVRPFKSTEDEKTEGGLFVPVNVKKDVMRGEVFAAGIGRYAAETGVFMPTMVAKGDIVLFAATQGMDVPIDTENGREEMRIMREGDILILVSRKDKIQ